MNYDYDVDAYHPRYTRSEYLTLEAAERRTRRMGLIGLGLILIGVAGLIYLMK